VVSEERKQVYVRELQDLTKEQLVWAFARVRREVKFFPKIAELRERADDGRPGVEVAWAMCPATEDSTVVWTSEMARAFIAGARTLRNAGDEIGARMAFKEAYSQLLAEARVRGDAVRWEASLGWDKAARIGPVAEAVRDGKITRDHAFQLIAPEQHDELEMALPLPERPRLDGEKRQQQAEVRLPGLHGILQQMRMDGTVPQGCDPKETEKYEPLSVDEEKRRREVLKAQAEQMRKRHGGAA
jgi:hypothetical protein